MSAVGAVASVLAWPGGSGVAGGGLLTMAVGLPGYLHTHAVLRRRHGERLAQSERHHAEHQAQHAAHHNTLVHLHERHHQRLLDAVAASAPVARRKAQGL